MAKITKKRIKEDKLISTTAKISIFINEHWKEIAGAIAVIVVIIGGLILYHGHTTSRNERAARSLREAKILFAEAEAALDSEGKIESTIQKYEKARAKFNEVSLSGHSYTIGEALFYSAKTSYQLGKYDEAISAFQKVIDKYPKSMFAFYARKGVGQCYEQLGGNENLRKAIQQYSQLSTYPETYITLKAVLDKGRCYEKLDELNQATTAYQVIVDKFKHKTELAIQAKSLSCVQKAKDVISKYETALGKSPSDSDIARFLDKAKAYEIDGQEQWFEALKMYDKAIFSRKEYWSQQKASGEQGHILQDASNALGEYENLSTNVIKNISMGRRDEKQGNWDNALRYYQRATQFDFLPGVDLFEEAQLQIDWINSVEKSS